MQKAAICSAKSRQRKSNSHRLTLVQTRKIQQKSGAAKRFISQSSRAITPPPGSPTCIFHSGKCTIG
ncbi:hypothetical protein RB543 [Rhodopirellula baltica SH 1]|uniref:Uncharacterized protein n=1 Tax=Rhodopirellula baltica (strain DSM 10527 / NCIMB 13988 / SH1) TaxID=243090 RepID=Q7UYK0_RHOBA|nr:hypothetical protein RB543 [Rhodopirellula baltica SH 1]